MKFTEYKFKKYINEALKDLDFYQATNIQAEVIPLVLKGESVIGKSKTGTGKTHSFLLPVLQELNENKFEVQSVIIVPTRELALQLFDEIQKITKKSEQLIDVRLFVGGTNREAELSRLEKSQPQIVIGTIGKITDLAINENALKIHTASIIVIDEADMVFESSEIVEVDRIFSKFKEDAQILTFSATIPNSLITFLNKYLSKVTVIDLTSNEISKDTIKHIFIPTKNKNKDNLLFDLLNSFHPYLALIFANTKDKVDEIADFLSTQHILVGKLTGNLQPRERKQVLKRIKDGKYQFVVASDIASRGIDISGVSHVINYELPDDIEFYVHRTGRTARYSSDGIAISFYDYEDDSYINKLEAKGLNCVYMTLKDNELIPTKERNAREKRNKQSTSLEDELHVKIPLPKKVKPGYKKKRLEEINKQIKKIKRKKIEEVYRNKARKDK